jgi:hypothetical protein
LGVKLKTIDVIKEKCELEKQQIIKELKDNVNISLDIKESIKGLKHLENIIDLKLKPLGAEISNLIDNSEEDRTYLEKESSIIFESTLSDIINSVF